MCERERGREGGRERETRGGELLRREASPCVLSVYVISLFLGPSLSLSLSLSFSLSLALSLSRALSLARSLSGVDIPNLNILGNFNSEQVGVNACALVRAGARACVRVRVRARACARADNKHSCMGRRQRWRRISRGSGSSRPVRGEGG